MIGEGFNDFTVYKLHEPVATVNDDHFHPQCGENRAIFTADNASAHHYHGTGDGRQVEHAIARLAAGTYGVCESCGNSIAKARLQALPHATLCVTCKQREERR